jgi:hypothetical protein
MRGVLVEYRTSLVAGNVSTIQMACPNKIQPEARTTDDVK